DADGLHPTSLGRLVLNEPGPLPCTPDTESPAASASGTLPTKQVPHAGAGPFLVDVTYRLLLSSAHPSSSGRMSMN
ncbi:hypothetical protein, partial [Streptomyces virginiae]